jgi:hypothetical protein
MPPQDPKFLEELLRLGQLLGAFRQRLRELVRSELVRIIRESFRKLFSSSTPTPVPQPTDKHDQPTNMMVKKDDTIRIQTTVVPDRSPWERFGFATALALVCWLGSPVIRALAL